MTNTIIPYFYSFSNCMEHRGGVVWIEMLVFSHWVVYLKPFNLVSDSVTFSYVHIMVYVSCVEFKCIKRLALIHQETPVRSLHSLMR